MDIARQKIYRKGVWPVPINEWLALPGNTQAKLANAIGTVQPALVRWKQEHREVYVCESPEGIQVFEVKELPNKRSPRNP